MDGTAARAPVAMIARVNVVAALHVDRRDERKRPARKKSRRSPDRTGEPQSRSVRCLRANDADGPSPCRKSANVTRPRRSPRPRVGDGPRARMSAWTARAVVQAVAAQCMALDDRHLRAKSGSPNGGIRPAVPADHHQVVYRPAGALPRAEAGHDRPALRLDWSSGLRREGRRRIRCKLPSVRKEGVCGFCASSAERPGRAIRAMTTVAAAVAITRLPTAPSVQTTPSGAVGQRQVAHQGFHTYSAVPGNTCRWRNPVRSQQTNARQSERVIQTLNGKSGDNRRSRTTGSRARRTAASTARNRGRLPVHWRSTARPFGRAGNDTVAATMLDGRNEQGAGGRSVREAGSSR